VLQCNASNKHGYAFAAGYINVLRMIPVYFSLPPFLFLRTSLVPKAGKVRKYSFKKQKSSWLEEMIPVTVRGVSQSVLRVEENL